MNNNFVPIKDEISGNRSLVHIFGWMVIGGVFLEVILAALNPDAWRIKIWPVFANALVVIGVYGEIYFSGKVSKSEEKLQRIAEEKIAEANLLAANALERAATLEKEAAEVRARTAEIEKLTAWRHVSPEQRKQVADAIRAKASSVDVLIEYERGDPEAYSYASELARIFVDSGCEKIRYGPNSFLGTVFGLVLATSPETEENVNAAIFSAAGISSTASNMDLSKHLPSNLTAPNLYIFVAPKPPPAMKVVPEP